MLKVLGTTDEITTCDCCGKANLKLTVALESDATGIIHYGRDCAARAIHGHNSRRNVNRVMDSAAAAVRHNQRVAEGKEARVSTDYNQANKLYARTGRTLAGSYFATRGAFVVRVDGKDTADASHYAAAGYTQATAAV